MPATRIQPRLTSRTIRVIRDTVVRGDKAPPYPVIRHIHTPATTNKIQINRDRVFRMGKMQLQISTTARVHVTDAGPCFLCDSTAWALRR